MSKHSCKECKFWEDLKIEGQDAGECRCGLPTIGVVAMPAAKHERPSFLNVGEWPVITSTKWCGQFEPLFKSTEWHSSDFDWKKGSSE